MRLFVAVWPSIGAAGALRRLPRPAVEGVRYVPEAAWHVTLRFLGELGDLAADDIAAQLADAPLPAATAVLGPHLALLGPGVLVAPVSGLDELADAVRSATRGPGDEDGHPFRGHLTLARARRSRTGARVLAELAGASIATSFAIEAVALVASELADGGPRYRELSRYTVG